MTETPFVSWKSKT